MTEISLLTFQMSRKNKKNCGHLKCLPWFYYFIVSWDSVQYSVSLSFLCNSSFLCPSLHTEFLNLSSSQISLCGHNQETLLYFCLHKWLISLPSCWQIWRKIMAVRLSNSQRSTGSTGILCYPLGQEKYSLTSSQTERKTMCILWQTYVTCP